MKRDLDKILMMPDKKTPMTYGSSGKHLTVAMMIVEACISMYPDELPVPTQREKEQRFKLSLRTELGGEQSFSREEIGVILRACHLKCGTWLYGQICAWAEGIDPFENIPKIEKAAE